jgi:hypothetical protein
MSAKKKHSKLILKRKEKLSALKKHENNIKFAWIPAHTDIALNEIADVSAKESIRIGEDAPYLIPDTDSKSYWKTEVNSVAAEEGHRESGK